jgi:acyl phosphate:glycerol-3-phosphate acyltransferase
MQTVTIIIASIGAYLIGSIPTSVWIGKLIFGVDVRKHGSGNAGATNTFRVLGVAAGIPVLAIDIMKGWAAVKLAYFADLYFPASESYIQLQLLLGFIAVSGHLYPVFARFKGGKGVATSVGAVLAIHPEAALICTGIWLICFLVTQYVSLSSIVAGLSFPIMVIIVFNATSLSLILFSFIVSIVFLLTHQKNIERLLRKQESKANLFRKRHKKEESHSKH